MLQLSPEERKALLDIERAMLRLDPNFADQFVSLELSMLRKNPPTSRRPGRRRTRRLGLPRADPERDT